ncbi:MAG: type II toxin-antitoxin system PemK/MazF family toxin [Deltaproteobacteria bacterium]|nr:type II toxin-antitoxin system PemK/MazF family toxin [Deltaproteobacteria bacterium]
MVLVKFPFANLETSKKRPALVLNQISYGKTQNLLIIAMITSKVDGVKLHGDVALKNWEKASLLHPSLVRVSKIATIDDDIIEKKIGHLSEKDIELVKKEIKKIFSWWL